MQGATAIADPIDHTSERRDRLTGFGDRDQLVADLTAALEPGSTPNVLAVFDLFGMSGYRSVHGEEASDELTARLAEALVRVVHPQESCYRPRQDEFCVLVAGRIDDDRVGDLLPAAAGALWNEAEPFLINSMYGAGEAFLITSMYGAVVLPDEASTPIEALMLADERLRALSNNRPPRERRQKTEPR